MSYRKRRGNNTYGSSSSGDRRDRRDYPDVRDEEETENRLNALMIRIGEKSNSSIESNLEILGEVLEKEFGAHKYQILATLGACVTEMPHKTCIYSTLVGLMNAKNYDFGQMFLEYVCKNLYQEILNSCDFVKARITTRFLGDLVNTNVLLPQVILGLFDQFMAVTTEMDIPQERADYYVGMILDTLPWVGLELSQTKPSELDQLLDRIGSYMNNRNKDYIPCLSVWVENSVNALPQEENLDALWQMIRNMEKKDWQEDAIMRPYKAFVSELSAAMQHTLPDIKIPDHNPGSSVYPLPQILFRLWDPVDIPQTEPSLPAADQIERYVIEEQIRGLLVFHEPNRKDCLKYLLSIEHSNRFPIEYMIIEVILGELFHLPAPQFRLIYYGVMLLELSKLPDSGFANILAMAVEMLFDRIETMDVECVQRLSNWFAWHLSNNDFKWNWADWSDVLQVPEEDPRVLFVKESLAKCVRMSYHDRVKRTLTEEMQAMMPPEIKPCFKYDPSTGHEFVDLAKEVVDAIRHKVPGDTILSLLDKLDTANSDAMQDDDQLLATKVTLFVQCLLYASSKSYSHVISAIERYVKSLQTLANTPEGRFQVVHSVFEYWATNHQMTIILMDKLMTYRVVDHQAIIHCLFHEDFVHFFVRDYVWEVLCNTLNKMIERTGQMKLTLAKEEVAFKELSENMDNRMEEDEHALVAKEHRLEQLRGTMDIVVTEQKEAFLIVFQRFVVLLTDAVQRCEQDRTDPTTDAWFRVTINRMKHIGRQ
eukprot:Ihof_evm30s18 gene=Ihof_evmTU30s18